MLKRFVKMVVLPFSLCNFYAQSMKLTTIFCIFRKISKELPKFTLSQISVAVIIDGQTLLL